MRIKYKFLLVGLRSVRFGKEIWRIRRWKEVNQLICPSIHLESFPRYSEHLCFLISSFVFVKKKRTMECVLSWFLNIIIEL